MYRKKESGKKGEGRREGERHSVYLSTACLGMPARVLRSLFSPWDSGRLFVTQPSQQPDGVGGNSGASQADRQVKCRPVANLEKDLKRAAFLGEAGIVCELQKCRRR